jgi:hypothetical protein
MPHTCVRSQQFPVCASSSVKIEVPLGGVTLFWHISSRVFCLLLLLSQQLHNLTSNEGGVFLCVCVCETPTCVLIVIIDANMWQTWCAPPPPAAFNRGNISLLKFYITTVALILCLNKIGAVVV